MGAVPLMASGWIKLHRQLAEWEWYDDHNTTRLFIHLLLKAQHAQTKYQGVIINAGSMKTGRKQLHRETGLSEQQVRTSLGKLKSTNEITIKTTKSYSIISVNNWSLHQQDNQPVNQQTTNKQPTDNQQVTTCKNDKNAENEKKSSAKAECDLILSELSGGRKEMITQWVNHKREIRKPYKPMGLKALITKLSKYSDDVVRKSIEDAMAAGWAGLFPEKNNSAKSGSNQTAKEASNGKEVDYSEGWK